jgi:hypothetical protein
MKTFPISVLGLVLAGAGCNRTPSSVDAAGLPGGGAGAGGYADVAGRGDAGRVRWSGNSAATPALARTARGSAAEIPSGTVVHVRLLRHARYKGNRAGDRFTATLDEPLVSATA